MRRNRVGQRLAHLDAARAGLVAMNHRRERIDRLGIEQDVHLDDIRDLVAVRFVVHRGITVRDGLQRVVEVD